MNRYVLRTLLALALLGHWQASAATFYVDANSASPAPPYASWATAAPDIQTAIDAASDGDQIWVTNGVYATGGRVVYGALTNRVVINKAVTVQSVNGPTATSIFGFANNGAASPTNGDNAIRCVYLTNNASLIGFTLAYGATRAAGDTTQELSGGGAWCEGTNAYLANCIITTNSAQASGAGSYSGTLTNCSLTYGVAVSISYGGGGAYGATLFHCTLAWNLATNGGDGGAAYHCLLNNCLVTSNAASYGSGIAFGTAYNCLFTGNGRVPGSASNWGSAAYLGTCFNCTLTGNTTAGLGTANGCNLINCIIAGNSNNGFADIYQCNLTNCCSPTGFGSSPVGSGDITNPPAFVDAAHGNYQLTLGSPGIDAGTNLYAPPGTDLAGNPRIFNGTVDMGAYESQFTNIIIHYVLAANAAPVAPYTNWLTAATNIQDAITAAKTNEYVVVGAGVFNYGGMKVNGYGLTNRVAITKPLTVIGIYGPTQTFISGNRPMGASAVRCAYVTNGAVLTGVTLTNGATLSSGNATYEVSGGGVLGESTSALIKNCVLMGNTAFNGGGSEGGTLTNCTVIHNTASYGGGVYGYSSIFSGALISNLVFNCLIVSNTGSQHGGGAFGSTLNNCLIASNSTGLYTGAGAAYSSLNNCLVISNSSPYQGGGVSYSSLNNCLLTGNFAQSDGGAALMCVLTNCTVVSNSIASSPGGGIYQCTAYNCIIYSNRASSAANYFNGTMTYCDTTPLASGLGNITNPPAFVNPAAGDYHLQANSPCINSGNNAYVTLATDLDGNPRIVGGTVDQGAYEYQTPASLISYAWLQNNSLPTDGSADYTDPDGDGLNNWQEWKAGTDPNNAASVLKMNAPSGGGSGGIAVTWQSVANINYLLQRGTNLPGPFSTIQSNLLGQAGTTSFTDTTATNSGPYFYRIGVQ